MSITADHALHDRTRDELATAIDIINRRLGQEALERGWCRSYELFIDRVNEQVGFPVLAPCTRPVAVTITYTAPRGWSVDGLWGDLRSAVLRHAGDYAEGVGDISIDVGVEGSDQDERG